MLAKSRKLKVAADPEGHSDEGTREKLLRAALELFVRQGFTETTTKQICEAAGANIAAVAYHFETKENLLNTLLSAHMGEDTDSIAQILKRSTTAEEFKVRLRLGCEALVNLVIKREMHHQLIRQESSRNPNALKFLLEATSGMKHLFTGFIQDAQERGFIAADLDPLTVSYFLKSALIGPAIDPMCARINPELDLRDVAKRDAYFDQVFRIAFHGLAAAKN